jgi:predicted methyltransferase
MSNESVREFVSRHRIKVIDDNKRAHKYTNMNVKYFSNSNDYNELTAMRVMETETVKLLTVEITESELERIANFEAEVFNNLKEHGHYRMFEHMADLKERERYLRNIYPAVKKAYEHYSLMLKIAESGEL